DCGTVVNPAMAVGQLEGGLSKGVGYALYEGCDWNADGQLMSRGLWLDDKIAAFNESPPIDNLQCFFTETYEPTGPFGAKGIGEAAMNPVAAAYANAITNAIGVRFFELPITPEKILSALDRQTEEGGES
ncbi:xanthine dehydrogenase family protein molybdopterin-binding subunit, partial [Candidatus Bipolaricaulota bacterium]|nr:xanthine dehydrogenase family protein molybdopterin-binding subunit [Candidatus Bipolaricaulota bacterium]